MTDSAAWVKADGEVQHLPTFPKTGYYWINLVRDWARSQDLKIEAGSWALEIVVPMNKRHALEFLDTVLQHDELEDLRARIAELPEDAVVQICADEF